MVACPDDKHTPEIALTTITGDNISGMITLTKLNVASGEIFKLYYLHAAVQYWGHWVQIYHIGLSSWSDTRTVSIPYKWYHTVFSGVAHH